MSKSPHSPTASPTAPSPSDAAQSIPSDNISSPPSAPSLSSPPSEDPAPGHQCQWVGCDKTLPDPESLYNHLCNDHIGRKSTGNLCLTCKWKDCGTTCAKRDHITSHLRGTYLFILLPLSRHQALRSDENAYALSGRPPLQSTHRSSRTSVKSARSHSSGLRI